MKSIAISTVLIVVFITQYSNTIGFLHGSVPMFPSLLIGIALIMFGTGFIDITLESIDEVIY